MAKASPAYPMSLTIDYPDKKLNRLTTFFRPFVAIPIAIILALMIGAVFGWEDGEWSYQYGTAGLVVLPIVLMLLFRQKYPKWWFDWNLALTRFSTRVSAYFALLRDEYPSTDEEQAVHLDIPYPNAKELNRWLPLVKWIMAIPHYIVLLFLYIAASVAVIIAWFAILFTGRYPKSLFDFVVGVYRWSLRVSVYAFLLTTDRYPPFSFSD
ncbi:MAG: DUF4389 domain-containing protein [Chloroflexi bacterium]|nr:DUF4389 domain-containing protein [Chloroflexota bacterium]